MPSSAPIGTRLAAATRAIAVKIVRVDRLLEEIEPAIGNRAHIVQRRLDAKTLIGVGRDEAILLARS